MAAKKATDQVDAAAESTVAEPKKEATFTKAQLTKSKRFEGRRDVLEAVLPDDPDRRYTLKQAQAAINEFFERKV